MEVTDRHFRALARLISRHATLYTEMVVDRTLIHNQALRDFSLRIPDQPAQHPVVLQLGGSVPEELEAAASIAAEYGYSEVNLNCGCPSPKVAGKGCFGAALMRMPHIVAEATRRMKSVLPANVPVTVKCRIGVDDEDSYEGLRDFVRIVHDEGEVNHFIIHARKAILGGLSPAQNRNIPPLKYSYVYDLVAEFPTIQFSINGGLKTIGDVEEQLRRGVHGVMVGRAVMDRPWHALCDVDRVVYGERYMPEAKGCFTRRTVINGYLEYAEKELERYGGSVRVVVKPLLNLFHGEPNGKKYRRVIDEGLRDKLSLREIMERACWVLAEDVLDAPPPSMRNKVVAGDRTGEDLEMVTGLKAEAPGIGNGVTDITVMRQREVKAAWLTAQVETNRVVEPLEISHWPSTENGSLTAK